MKLRELLVGTDVADVTGDGDTEIASLVYDSSRVAPGALFFSIRGQRVDGHDFAAAAVERGAAALVVERRLDLPAPQVVVGNARAAMAPIAIRFWGDPTATLRVAGVTGTNGKTTTAFLIRHVLESQGTRTGLLGTVKSVVGGAEEEVERTTPEAIDLQETFRRMLDAGDEACAMEVSSHALAQNRTDGVRFAVAVFTNLTQDHLDFHTDMEEYFQAKRGLFLSGDGIAQRAGGGQRSPAVAVVNIDDPYGARLAADLGDAGEPPLRTFSAGGAEGADYRALDAAFDASGSRFRCVGPEGEVQVRTPLAGHFNVENALAALAACRALGVPPEAAARSLADVGRVPGRFEPVEAGQPFAVLVDYAHTPDSLENVLRAARLLTDGRLVCVFGCGGDRDRDKRPKMGAIAARLADRCVITSDNPRSEDPQAIIAEILAGIPGSANGGGGDGVVVEPDRREAMAVAFAGAEPGDTVVIAGKGHEQGQEFAGGRKIPFDDRTVAAELLTQGLRSPLDEGA
jgi:UDP-N-acetylmuramoyl-L-alanyl-D-glutamate--2,6-diaminopimelate ligase